jgi:hypothetical protein
VVSSSEVLGVVANTWSIVESGDFNGDGKDDLLWRNTATNDVAIWFLNGTQVSSQANNGTVAPDWTIQNVNVN